VGHVFISYARPDEPLAQLIAEELRGAGFEVWRDDELPAHRAYAEVIEERINGAQAVVVLWSGEAARSHWVRAEADTRLLPRGSHVSNALPGWRAFSTGIEEAVKPSRLFASSGLGAAPVHRARPAFDSRPE